MSAVVRYSIRLLSYDACKTRLAPRRLIAHLRAWRHHHSFAAECRQCERRVRFGRRQFAICCQNFYYRPIRRDDYPIESIAVATPGYTFALPQLRKALERHRIASDQQHLIVPDPIYWQVSTTLVLEKIMKFVSGEPITKRTDQIQPSSKSHLFYKQLMDVTLNYGSLTDRSTGKSTLMRKYAFGKRTVDANRAVIVPDATLRPNEIALPRHTVDKYALIGKYVLIGRMPTLDNRNLRALRCVRAWDVPCIGIPLEIVQGMNADFDGDECNVYIVRSLQSQAECAELLDSERAMGSFGGEINLAPGQDMLVAYRLFYDDVRFLPRKNPDLRVTFRILYDLYGSETTFRAFDDMRRFYLETLRDRTFFAVTLREMHRLVALARRAKSVDEFARRARAIEAKSCLVTQVESDAKGSYDHLYQLFGSMGGEPGSSSFWDGMTPREAVAHALTSVDALSQQSKIWEPGYGYSKSVYNLQGLVVDYAGQLVDGRRVIQSDVLNAMHHTDVMSTEGFRELVRTTCGESSGDRG